MRKLLHFKKSLLIILILIGAVNQSKAQLTITTPDTTICPNTSAILNATVGSGVLTPITYTALDDSYSGVQNIGFTFNFFGNNYSTCIVSQNGYVKFNTAQAGQFSPWTINAAIPGNTNVLNSIMGYYCDIFPGTGTPPGVIEAATLGVAPFRKYVVNFCGCPMFSCTAVRASFQIILYETTNEIEVHIGNAPGCTTWNGGNAIEGIQDNAGTTAFWVPGRNFPTQWTAVQSSHRFTPTSSSNYTVTAIPYAPIPSPGSNITWFANGVTQVGTGTSVTVTPTTNTYYVAMTTKCSDTIRDTVYVTLGGGPTITNINPFPGNPNYPASQGDPTTCGGTNGFFSLYLLDPNQLYTVHYRKNGVQQPPLTVTSTIYGVINMTGLTAGVYDSVIVFKGLCFSNVVGPITLTDPPVVASFTYDLHKGCDQDTVFFTNSSIQNLFNIWDFGDGFGDTVVNPTHIYLTQGIYNVKLMVNNGICKDSSIQSINTLHPIAASFIVDDDSACANQMLSFTNTSSGTNPTYFWDFGDSTTSTQTNPVHAYSNPGTYTVMMVVTDDIPCYDTFYMNILVDTIPYASFVTTDSVLCEGTGITFYGDYLRTGNTGVTWTFGDGNFIVDKDQVLHAYDTAGTFKVVLTAAYRNCPDETYTKDVVIKPYPFINLGRDTFLCPNGKALYIGDSKNASNAGASWLWNTGETTSSIFVRHPGIYTAKVKVNGCENSDSVEVFKDCYLDIPNSFTPNGDGTNDYFLPRQLLSRGLTVFKMSVFNRWGQTIFETSKLDGRGWDGKFNDQEQPTGAYIYLIEIELKDGNTEKYQGNVTLLR